VAAEQEIGAYEVVGRMPLHGDGEERLGSAVVVVAAVAA